MDAETQAAVQDAVLVEESRRLDEVLALVHAASERAGGLFARIDEGNRDALRDIAESRGEMAPEERHQQELLMGDLGRQAFEAHRASSRLAKLLDSPYFARIDFAPDAGGEGGAGAGAVVGADPVAEADAVVRADAATVPASTYLGRFTFTHATNTVVSDWRSPVAGLFYDFEPGPAHYDAPTGRVDGRLVLKRQIKVEQGRLVYAVDSSSSVRDEVLAGALSRTSDARMQNIVASIQKEQNAIIRDESAATLVIQGVAGSGKTSIALHRIAYLLYRQKDLSAKAVVILSPNKVFGDYISGVLPELGEEPVDERGLADVAEPLLPKLDVEPQRSAADDADAAHRARVSVKGTVAFADELAAFLDGASDGLFAGADLAFGRHGVSGEWLQERYGSYAGLPVDERLDLVAGDALREMEAARYGRDRLTLPKRAEVRRRLAGMLAERDGLALYRRFLRETGRAGLLVQPGRRALEWEDACPVALCQGAFAGFEAYFGVRHLVVDEMQDLTPVQHRLVARLFPCNKTILGDVNQAIGGEGGTSLADLAAAYPGARCVQLMRSYRSTYEITQLANRVKPVAGLMPVKRHGEAPRLVACANTAEVLARVLEAVRAFEAGGRRTLGIVCKTDDLARRYAELLSRDVDAHLITPESTHFTDGVSVASVRMAKGLEFDEAVVLDADARLYATELDRNLLYVAITRAMHRLTVLYRGTPSPFFAG